MNDTDRKNILITGVSSGIGRGLAQYYLAARHRVCGLSRRNPRDLRQRGLQFVGCDLGDPAAIAPAVGRLISDHSRLDLVILNAGVLGRFGDLADAEHDDLTRTMQINVWSNVAVLNSIFCRLLEVAQVVAISSGASMNGNRGWSGYSVSKAGLNMLMKLYSRERQDTHFCALAPGLVDTAMQDELCGRDPDQRYPAIDVLRQKRHTPEMPDPQRAAEMLADVIQRLPKHVESGQYADVRSLPAG
jgi:NAD(P)-dependent dehydrogenase (short-subunit alcohol dehydrogenase family)